MQIQTRQTADLFIVAVDGSPLLRQVTRQAGGRKYQIGKLAYDYIHSVLATPAENISSVVAALGLPSIGSRRIEDDTEAALAVAAAAVLDVSKGRRLTATEQLEAACDYLDDELAAGW